MAKQEAAAKAAPKAAPAAPKAPTSSFFQDWEIKDRVFILKSKNKPETLWIQTKPSKRNPLIIHDAGLKKNRILRYAENYDSPFMDEQDEGTVVLRHAKFNHGTLFVPKEQEGLQKFLLLSPEYDRKWEMLDKQKEAEDEVVSLDIEFEAQALSRELDLGHLEAIMRSELGSKVDTISTEELKRDARIFAKKQPRLFIELASDEDLKLRNLAIKSVEFGLLRITPEADKVLWGENDRKIIDVGFDENPYKKLSQYFKKDEGIDLMKRLQKALK